MFILPGGSELINTIIWIRSSPSRSLYSNGSIRPYKTISMSSRIKAPYCNPEIWGGIECTINRIKDEYSDQLFETGHYSRPGDIDHLASIGIKALRYPLLWERHQPERETVIDWSWADRQLGRIRRRGMTPIAGLLHHGSG